MPASWVAASLRAQSLSRHRLGRDGARAVAAERSLDGALRRLSATAYGHDVAVGQSLEDAQDAVWAAVLWDLRVVAGWLPRAGADVVRTLAGHWEIWIPSSARGTLRRYASG